MGLLLIVLLIALAAVRRVDVFLWVCVAALSVLIYLAVPLTSFHL